MHHSHILATEEIAIIAIVGSILALFLASLWKMFEKAGQPGWAALVPIYNAYIITQIAGKSGWLTVTLFLPIFNIIARVVLGMEVAKKFDRSTAFGLGLGFFPILFVPMLAFSRSEYMDAIPPDGYRTFINEEGDLVEEVPLEEWGNDGAEN